VHPVISRRRRVVERADLVVIVQQVHDQRLAQQDVRFLASLERGHVVWPVEVDQRDVFPLPCSVGRSTGIRRHESRAWLMAVRTLAWWMNLDYYGKHIQDRRMKADH
jgi:hypothetical protein